MNSSTLKERTYTLEELDELAAWMLEQLKGKRVFAFNGNMGAGKTTLITALCRKLGVTETISSPTFSIINEYEYKMGNATDLIYHMDLYRLKDQEEAITAGIEDCLYSGHYCFVEWAERAPELFGEGTVCIYLYHDSDSRTRSLEIEQK
ncbi:tRNA (adenosine(37)-N6)-threonylcarbamoyltransferase complex ATPase subunit type 1 TsaE [Niabella terrae]